MKILVKMTSFFPIFLSISYLCLLVDSSAIPKNKNRDQSYPAREQVEHRFSQRHTQDSSTCSSELKQCKRKKDCRTAIRDMKIRCVTKSDQCDARMHDLSKCAEIMDKITEYFNPERKCTCQNKKESRCSLIHKTIYENPCFASVKFLREKNMMPRTENQPTNNLTNEKEDIGSHDLINELIKLDEEEVITKKPNLSEEKDQKSMLNKKLENFLQYSNIKPTPASVSEEDSSPKDQTSSNQNSLMLHIVLVISCLFFLAVLVVVGGILLYCRLWRNGKKTRKTIISKP